MTEQLTEKGQAKQSKAMLCMLKTDVHDHTIYRIKLDELSSLVETLGIEVVGEVIQSRYRPFSKFFIGSGKVKEIGRKVRKLGIDLVIFYNILKSSQKLNLIRALNCDVIDRYELTLEIFDQMASDRLSKLQIQAARLEKQAPFYKLQASINYRYDRPFFRAGGEYAFHGQMRELSRNQAKVREEIDRLIEEKNQRIWNRRKLGYPVVCIAGFYNAGKTSLFNAVTGDNKPVSDRPFTTLSSKYQRRFIDHETTVLFIDTIGFVIDVDPRLIQSFKLNLLDIRSSDIVILLLEITDPSIKLQMKLTEGIRLLKDIGVSHNRIVIVFNKLDKSPEMEERIADDLSLEQLGIPWIAVSALKRRNLQEMLHIISDRLRGFKENPPKLEELSAFQRTETTINRVLEHYPVEYVPRGYDPFRGLVSTILSQNTNSKNQRTAFSRLEESVGVTPYRIDAASEEQIAEAIKPAGMYNQRTHTLKAVSRGIIEKYDGDLQSVFDMTFPEARDRLMEFPGVGAKTADVALMFVANHQVIPVDRHIERVSKRLEIVTQKAGYEEVSRALEDGSHPDRFRDVHLSLIRFGRETCRAKRPHCSECVINDICPYPEKAGLDLSETVHSDQ